MSAQGGRAAPLPLDPIVSLAVAIAESPGAYAFLLGAGVSKDAGVPTGGDVRSIALNDLYRLDHPDEKLPDDDTLTAWIAESGYGEITYSEILERLGPDPEGRRAYLAKYFEGREPGETHRLLARLAADGLVGVFVTTNFDRLLEQALGEVGITPVVISTDDQFRQASEREHARCYVLKVHGDYLQQTIRNTTSELAELEPKIAADLQEIVDRFGLVALGYSGSDAAVATCLRGRNSRRSVYWVSRGEPAETAATLIEAMGARVIRRGSATEFLTDLSRRIAAFRAQPSGNTPESVMAEVMRLLRQSDRVGLREKLKQEWRTFEARLQDMVEPRAGSQSVEVEIAKEVDRQLTPVFERMLAALFPLVDYGEELFTEQLRWMQRLVERVKERQSGWPELLQWGVWWLAQACGAYAMSRERFDVVAALLRVHVDDRRKIGDTLATFVPADVGQMVAANALEPQRRRDSGAEWTHLTERLNESSFIADAYPELVDAPGGAERWADDFNFVATAAVTLKDGSRVVGYWGMHGDGGDLLAQRLGRDAAFADELARGCFGISGEELMATIKPAMAAAISQTGKTIFTPGAGWFASDAIYNLPEPPTPATERT